MKERELYRPGLVRNQSLVDQLKELQKNPRSLVFVSLAELYRTEQLPHQALEILDDGLAYHPGLTSALLARSRCFFDLRRYAEAAAVCQEILAANPENIKAQRLQADIFVRLGQRKAAIRALTRVVTLFPQDREAVKALEELENLEFGSAVPTERLSRASVDTFLSSPAGRIGDFQVGSITESLAAISQSKSEERLSSPKPIETESRVVSTQPEEPSEVDDVGAEPTFATRTIAELYLRQGLKQKAEKVLRKILREDPTNHWARETLQDLGSDEIVLPTKTPEVEPRRAALEARARVLERLLAQVRLHKTRAGSA